MVATTISAVNMLRDEASPDTARIGVDSIGMNENLNKVIKALASDGHGDRRGHQSVALDKLQSETGLGVEELRDLIALHPSMFDPALTRSPLGGVISTGLSTEGRQAARTLGVTGPSPVEDSRALLAHVVEAIGDNPHKAWTSKNAAIDLGWHYARLEDAARVLERSGDVTVERAIGICLISLTPQGRASSAEAKRTPMTSTTAPRSTILVALPTETSFRWQALNGPDDEDSIVITFSVTTQEKTRRRQTFEEVQRWLSTTSVPWLATGRSIWKVNGRLLRAEFPWLANYQWLNDGDVSIEPEFEDREREIFARRQYSGVITLRITPAVAVPELRPEHERTKIIVFHGPNNVTKHELLAWLCGADIQANARTVGEMPAHADGTVGTRVQTMIEWADKAIAIVDRDERSPSGAPNVIEEIGRWMGAGRAADLAIVRHRECDDIWSNAAGVVRLEFEARIKETFLGLAKFLNALGPRN